MAAQHDVWQHIRFTMYKVLKTLLLFFVLSATAHSQSIKPGKYKIEEFNRVHRAAFDFDGSGLLVTENRDETISLIMEYRWHVAESRLVQTNIRFTKNRVKWFRTDDTSVLIRNITPTSFELQTDKGWVKWERE